MKTKQWATLVSSCVMVLMLTVGLAEAANGTLKYTLKYKDPTTGVETNLTRGYVYLHDATKPPPMEKYFTKADYVNMASFGNGTYSDPNVPAGTWYIRITQRKGAVKAYGPPEAGDYTWMQTAPITITAGSTLDLGTLYAYPFAAAPITITGTVKSQTGAPVAGRYVRAQTEPCRDDGYNYDINQCGPVKLLALQPTDANGTYTLQIKDPGTYYLYTSPCITADYLPYTGNRCEYTAAPANPVTVKIRDVKTVDMVVSVHP
ncbi:MAG: hypothetical protein CXR31_10510 [Geobacter sp.]|nr:MAG: hypothetical protein CXR31_10510 [Geobacter sp.]